MLSPLLRRSPACLRPLSRSFAAPSLKEGKFDAETAAVYSKMAGQHMHPAGPWLAMLAEVERAAGGRPATVLDVASGMGQPAHLIASALPLATVLATDFSEEMVAKADALAEGTPNMAACFLDAQDMAAIADESQDVVVCCYGYMFPEDKVEALRETRRVLKAGGTLVATTWDRVDILSISRDVMTAVLGKPPPPPPMNPMSLSEPGLFKSLLVEAGFDEGEIKQTTSTYPFDLGDDKKFQFKVGTILLKDSIEELDAWEVAEEAFWKNIGKYARMEGGSMTLPDNTFRMTVVTK